MLCSLFLLPGKAEIWRTHFAYNNVSQIALSDDLVFAVSDGSLFSVDKQTETMKVYNRQSGLHSTGITCIHYDQEGKQLIIAYSTGKIDILTSQGVKYLSELYDKDMTQLKTIYNVTIHGRTAYLSTHYGVQTMDLRENKLVDSYWLRPNGEETPVQDVLIANDSIYAFTTDSMFCASMKANLVDYTFWKRELRTGRVSPDPKKGKEYEEANDIWYAAYESGIKRYSKVSGRWMAYKPNGPQLNTPYSLYAREGRVFMLAGGRWASQYGRMGHVMRYEKKHWSCITRNQIEAKTGNPARDFMNVAVDPKDKNHYFVTSYGTGLFEFRGDSVVRQYLPDETNTLSAAAPSNPTFYTRVNCATYDPDGNLWLFTDGRATVVDYQLVCLDTEGQWHGIHAVADGAVVGIPTSTGLVIDALRPNYKWFTNGREGACMCILDDGGTRWDESDDRLVKREQWTDQHGQIFQPNLYYGLMQDAQGRVWMATDIGAGYFEPDVDYFQSDAIVLPDLEDASGENPLTTVRVNAFCQTPEGDIWVGTTQGVYVLDSEATRIKIHYTTENSSMPDNGVLSLACDEFNVMWIGTSEGLVEYNPNTSEGLNGSASDEETTQTLDPGVMQQWRLHMSYSDPQEIAATPERIFAAANGSLFSVDRTDQTIEYWNKSTGLNGSSVAHIAYDAKAGQLIIGYEDGRIDLLDAKGNVTQMPDIYMKAGSVAVTINHIAVGSRYTYLSMPFGIVAINPSKAEVSDTYYIGSDASAVDVQMVVEQGDSLYAFGENKIYSACLKDNLVDYTYWKQLPVLTDQLQYAATYKNQLYTLQHNTLYRWANNAWQVVLPELADIIQWLHVSGNALLVYSQGKGLFRLTDDDQAMGLTGMYNLTDGIYSSGEYWVARTNTGLIKLRTGGDEVYTAWGPNSNFGYCMTTAHEQLYSAIGGRWASQYLRYGKINIFDGTDWRSINNSDIGTAVGASAIDIVSIAVDPSDAGHFYAATYGTGLFEFQDYKAVKHYNKENSTLRETKEGHDPKYYTRTDGAMIDKEGNLWVMNATETKDGKPLHILTTYGQWIGIPLRSYGENLSFSTPAGIWIDRRSEQRKWMLDQRETPGVVLLDDGGTPTRTGDDQCVKRTSFVDQNGNILSPAQFRSWAQDHTNRVWIGTEKGIIVIPANVDFMSSNSCRRIIIPRNDGTGLGDYLLGDEQINCLAVDGGNRMWIGTANSGLYLIEDDTITVAHFTETNSLLPSNTIQSIAIMPTTGEVFVGTDKCIASYRSDASEAKEEMKEAYAFPNPVRPDYSGDISIVGLMENTVVNIIDAGGNLVCKTKSHGGTAVWDGKLPDGRRATAGVYTALCNAEGGHTVVKILVIR